MKGLGSPGTKEASGEGIGNNGLGKGARHYE